MGCDSSQFAKQVYDSEMKISIIDSNFMKKSNQSIRAEMEEAKIQFDFYISLSIFYEEFSKRYYNEVVTSFEHYDELMHQLKKKNFYPNIYVITQEPHLMLNRKNPGNVTILESYRALIDLLFQKKKRKAQRNHHHSHEHQPSKHTIHIPVKILWDADSHTSEQDILKSTFKKNQINFRHYTSFQDLEESMTDSDSQFIIVDYMYHQQTAELVSKSKTKVICYSSFEEGEKYAPSLYFVSNNTLEIGNEIKKQISLSNKPQIKCTKVYLYVHELPEYDEIKYVIENFDIDVRPFSRAEKVIKETTYFFCVTVIAAETQILNLHKIFIQNDYGDRVKLISINPNIKPTIENLHKTIKQIKNGYRTQKAITKSIDIIDKHSESSKFEQIKRELQANDITYYGYENLAEYVKMKKFISPFIICNFQEKMHLVRYLKQLQMKAKIIIFCNKNKITNQVTNKRCFAFVSSHFGKIIKFIKKNHVYNPILLDEKQKKLQENIEKMQIKNRRISALKWCGIETLETSENTDNMEEFQFLNVSESTNHATIKDIQKSVSMIWRIETSILSNFAEFKQNLISSLKQLKKTLKINYPNYLFNELIDKIKQMKLNELIQQTREFFETSHQFGLAINNSLVLLDKIDRKGISSMRQFFILANMNYLSLFKMPKIGKVHLFHWFSNPLIQKCEVGSFLICKKFFVMYENNLKTSQDQLSPYKIELEIDYDTIKDDDLAIKPFFVHKNKYIFSPYSQFQLLKIENTGKHKVIILKFICNQDFLMRLYEDNILKEQNKSLMELYDKIVAKDQRYLEFSSQESFQQIKHVHDRLQSLELFKSGKHEAAIRKHKHLIQISEDEQNFDSSKINELKYELFHFLSEADSEETAQVMKELLTSHPGTFIKENCELVVNNIAKKSEQHSQHQLSDHKIPQGREKSRSRVSNQVYETYLWLQKNEQLSEKLEEQQESESNSDKAENIEKYEMLKDELKCMVVDDELEPEHGEAQNVHLFEGKENLS